MSLMLLKHLIRTGTGLGRPNMKRHACVILTSWRQLETAQARDIHPSRFKKKGSVQYTTMVCTLVRPRTSKLMYFHEPQSARFVTCHLKKFMAQPPKPPKGP